MDAKTRSEEEKALEEASGSMKVTVWALQEHVKKQGLLYESIEEEASRSSRLLSSNIAKFERAVRRINKDPRNRIILISVFIIIVCLFYLLL